MRSPISAGTSERELFSRNSYGKPVIAPTPHSLFSFGLLIRETEQALLRLFSEGLLSGTTHTCLGQELCQMSVGGRSTTPAATLSSQTTATTGIF